jgi:Co/Zn/Cd efflux system component
LWITDCETPNISFDEVGKILRPTIFAWMLIIILVILGFFLFLSVVSQEGGDADHPPSEAIVTTVAGLLITIVLCVSVSLWVILVDKKAKRLEKTLLVVGIIVASIVFIFSSVLTSMGSQWWQNNAGNSTAAKILSTVTDYLFVIGVILAGAFVLVFLVQYYDELVLGKEGPFPANKIEQRKPLPSS